MKPFPLACLLALALSAPARALGSGIEIHPYGPGDAGLFSHGVFMRNGLVIQTESAGVLGIVPFFVVHEPEDKKWRDMTLRGGITWSVEGGKASGQAAATSQFAEGFEVSYKASVAASKNTLEFESSWQTTGDTEGHIRADIVIPHDLAATLRIEGGDGKILWQDGAPGKAGLHRGPVTVYKSGGAALFTINGDFFIGVAPASTPDRAGDLSLRISPYKINSVTSVSEFSEHSFTIQFP